MYGFMYHTFENFRYIVHLFYTKNTNFQCKLSFLRNLNQLCTKHNFHFSTLMCNMDFALSLYISNRYKCKHYHNKFNYWHNGYFNGILRILILKILHFYNVFSKNYCHSSILCQSKCKYCFHKFILARGNDYFPDIIHKLQYLILS